MTRTEYKLFFFVLALSLAMFVSATRAQTPGDALDAALADGEAASIAGDAALGEEIDALKAVQSAQGDALADAVARIEALENAGPFEPPVDPEPVMLSAFILNLDDGAQTPVMGATVTVPEGRYTVAVTDDAPPPVRFLINGAVCKDNDGKENAPPFHACGDNNPAPLNIGDNAVDIAAGAGAVAAFTITVDARAPPVEPPDPAEPGDTLIQVGPYTPNPANFEEPFLNLMRAGSVSWTETDAVNTQYLYDSGVLDPVTGLPNALPNGFMRTGVYFTSPPGENKDHWIDDYVLEWECEDGTPDCADLRLFWFPDNQQELVAPGRVEFFRTGANDHAAIRALRIDGQIKAVRMFRKEHEALIRAGLIYNPRLVAEVSKYHVVRTMDLQEVNRTALTTVDELATMDACCWNNIAWNFPPRRIDHPFRSMPIEAVVALAVEADTMLWHQAPMELGAPKRLFDPSIMDETDDNAVAGAWRTLARENAAEIMASDEWERYTDKFVAALGARGYPETRPLYTTVSNEVWNTAFHYFVSTNYAWGLGMGLTEFRDTFSYGYGAALARHALAMEASLAKAGRAQAVVYVVERQAANTSTTPEALRAVRDTLEAAGEDWDDWKDKFGLSVASYWGGMPNWRAAGTVDEWENPTPSFWARVEDRILNGPDTEVATLPWVLARFADHEREAAKFGVKLIGAYEGGSHFEKPGEMPDAPYEQWHWGEAGARINKAVNDALAAKYPGIILSNYVLAGPKGGQPWFDGPPGDNGPMNKSWQAYQKGQ